MSFLDVGFSLTPNSMTSFQNNAFILLIGAFLIIIGNTGFPCLLRFIIWVFHKLAPEETSVKESLHFLLDHPRRCFTLMFPSGATWALFGILLLLNAADTILFVALDWNNPELANISDGTKILDGIYQASSTRTAGFSVVNLANLAPAVQVSYMSKSPNFPLV
jgi:Trk-type K+ transport system membrane component